jgi:hypothetical protein
MKLIIRIMFGPRTDWAIAKKIGEFLSVIQPWVATTKLRTSGRTVGKPPKLMTPLFTVQRIDTIRVFCDVPENDVPHRRRHRLRPRLNGENRRASTTE